MWRRPLEWSLNGTTDPRDGSVDHLSLNSLKDRHGPIRAPKSRIIINAHRINQGLTPDLRAPAGDSDFYFVAAEDPETAVQRILELVKTRIPKRFGLNAIRDIQVLCPMNRGGVGARSL